jgi:hypothetical protein
MLLKEDLLEIFLQFLPLRPFKVSLSITYVHKWILDIGLTPILSVE